MKKKPSKKRSSARIAYDRLMEYTKPETDRIVIGGKTINLTPEFVQEVTKLAEKYSKKEPETFEDCSKVHHGSRWQMIISSGSIPYTSIQSAVPSEKRARQLAAIAKMMTVADALSTFSQKPSCCITFRIESGVGISDSSAALVKFSDAEVAKKAIKILGEETIKTAFGL